MGGKRGLAAVLSERRMAILGSACTAAIMAGAPSPALAQSEARADSGEIIVTARKRQESILEVPVVVTAISNEKLQATGIANVTELPKLVPGLVIAGNLLSIGPQVTIRGVGTSSFDPGVDQSVSLNIDGLSLGQGLAFGSAMFDVAQVEVLKGPQALFYGKSSPGGVISLRTADPTSDVELIARGGYEFVAREWRGELIASGPVSQTLGARLGVLYSQADGYFKNNAVAIPGTGGMTPEHTRISRPRNFVARGTLLWEPVDGFSARLKVNHAYDRSTNAELKQLGNCPDGPGRAFVPFPPLPPVSFIANDDCRLNRDASTVYLDPASFPGVPNGGVPYLRNVQNYGTLELGYDVAPEINLTSTTAYYKLNSRSMVNPNGSSAAGPAFAVTNRFSRREFTEELRLNSDFSGPLNFTVGAFYEDGRLYDRVRFIRNRSYVFLSPAVAGADILNDDRASEIDIRTYSAFGQLRYEIADVIEVAAGARWTNEQRRLAVFDFQNNVDLTPFLPRPKVKSDTISPELTLTYTPNEDLTVFGSLKKGFKSGSFSVAVPANAIRDASGQIIGAEDKSFDDEKVKGYEIGVKSRLFDRQLIANLAFYDYYYRGLQVGGIEGAKNSTPVIRTVNAGRARTYGIDFDLAYRPAAIDGLSITAALNWNKGRYTELDNIPCLINQTFAQGCNTLFAPPTPAQARLPADAGVTVNGVYGFYNAQDLSGSQLIRAPEWSVNFGFDYEMPIGSGMKLQLTNNNQYSSRYPSYLGAGRPNNDNFQDGFFKIDASLALKAEDDRWEVALIGKNLTDKLTASNCSATNAAGGGVLPFNGNYAGGSRLGPLGTADVTCFVDGPGRQVWLRLTLRP
jgi:iron complex outermembrane receptor protein